jgi:hypothetical protein
MLFRCCCFFFHFIKQFSLSLSEWLANKIKKMIEKEREKIFDLAGDSTVELDPLGQG